VTTKGSDTRRISIVIADKSTPGRMTRLRDSGVLSKGANFPVRQEKAFVDETTLKDISRVSIHRLDSSSRADNTFLYCPSPASCLASVHCMSRVTLHTQTPQIVLIVVLTPAILIWRNACRTSHGWTRALTETRQLLPQPRCLACRLPACYPARAHGKSTQTQFERFRRHCSSRCSHELGLTPTSVSHNHPVTTTWTRTRRRQTS
jgi:hypothetical protein